MIQSAEIAFGFIKSSISNVNESLCATIFSFPLLSFKYFVSNKVDVILFNFSLFLLMFLV